jgi:hypothetical protein
LIKKVLRQKTSKQNPEGSRRENRKNEKQIVAASYATRISRKATRNAEPQRYA